ncbi:hypothetical protein F3Y22_tig00116997pilonHSYRG00256 [Hibiscus syriacus]|uniref:Uncharacterized protein n=1 Tax=Hibiscus syriacus TaxID=106335 RepID=A0A6A2XK29_HIBSY|nr:hypothetical protein F3Y22_tig00116997pilonHSYRG00256 [Hibiscus syriacus]
MALGSTAALVLVVLAFARVQLSTCQVVNAKISCLDCKHNYDLSGCLFNSNSFLTCLKSVRLSYLHLLAGIKVAVKCDKVKKLATATTQENGVFKVELPATSTDCLAKLLGGPEQLYGKNKDLVSKVVKVSHDANSYTISTPLAFTTSCPLASVDAKPCGVSSSKTVDLPLPPEWGLAPSSYYVPFIPIIGIP